MRLRIVLKGCKWSYKIFKSLLLIAIRFVWVHLCVENLLHRIRKALPLNVSSLVVLLPPLFFAPSVGALAPGCESTHDRVSWVQALRSTQTDLISVSPS